MTLGDSAVSELCRRIRRDIAQGQPLYGMKFFETFEERSEKADDLPRVYIVDYSDREEISGAGGINTPLRQSAVLGMQLVVDRRNGWLTDETVTNIRKMGALNVRNLLCDMIETYDDGQKDASLNARLDKPVMFATRESGVFDLGIVIEISITLDGTRFGRAERSCLNAPHS